MNNTTTMESRPPDSVARQRDAMDMEQPSRNRSAQRSLALSVVASGLATIWAQPSLFAAEPAKEAVAIGTRVEMFVDDWLIDPGRSPGTVSLQLQAPTRREIVLVTDKPWEGPDSAYFTVFQDGPLVRLYYRGIVPAGDTSAGQVTCYAESTDGIHFTRPNLGIVEFQGSKENNIIHRGVECHNFAPFLDANPAARPEQRYKALAGIQAKLYAFISPDGIHWTKLQAEPVMTKGAFDSGHSAATCPPGESCSSIRRSSPCTSPNTTNGRTIGCAASPCAGTASPRSTPAPRAASSPHAL